MNTPKPLQFLWLFIALAVSALGQPCSVTITSNPTTVCAGQPTTLTANVTGNSGNVTYSWAASIPPNPTGNGQNVTVTPTAPNTTYTVTLNGGGCNGVSASVQVNVNALPNTPTIAVNPNTPQCAGTPISFSVSNPQGGVTYSWNFGDNTTANGTPTSHSYNPAAGNGNINYTVTVTATNGSGCTATATQSVTVRQKPNAVLNDPINNFKLCGGSGNISVYDASTPASNSNYVINWGDGTSNYSSTTAPQGVSHIYQSGVYNISYTVTGSNGCSHTIQRTVYNITNPEIGAANPGNTQGCGPKNICFPINTFSNNDASTTYTVDYGDGTPIQVFTHPPPDTICHNYTITSCGKPSNAYTFKITAGNGCDTSVATIFPVRVYTPPVAQFTVNPNPGCVNNPITFTNNTIVGSNNNCDTTTLYTWNFGDGTPNATTTSKAAQTHTYTSAGTYTITLSAQNSCGTSPATQTVCIQSPPNPSFTATPLTGCSPLVVNFNNTSTNVNQCGTITRQWIVTQTTQTCTQDSTNVFVFISGTNSTSQNPVIRFNNAGTYTVQLRLTNVCGTFNSPTQVIRVRRKPELTISVTPNPICLGQTVTPTATVQNCDTPIVSYNWTFTGGTPATSSQLNPGSISYTTGGNKAILLTVQNACGSATANTSVTVNTPSSANAGPDQSVCINSPSFQLNGTPAGGTWSGTNVTSNGVFTPTQAGTFYLVYTTGSGNCLGRDTMVMTVNPLPNITVTPSAPSICAGGNITLTASGANSYTWSPTTGLNPTTGATVTASPNTTTTYTVTGLNTTTNCSASATVTITVNPIPSVTLPAAQTVCSGVATTAVNLTSSVSGTTYTWSGSSPNGVTGFPANGTSTSIPSFTPTNNGTTAGTITYSITPTANNCLGNPVTYTYTVNPRPVISPVSPQTICSGQSTTAVTLSANVTGTTFQWTSTVNGSITGNTASGNGNIPVQTLTNSGTTAGIVTYTITPTANNCQGNPTNFVVTINPTPVISPINNQTICSGQNTIVVNPSSNVSGTTYQWSSTASPNVTGNTASGTGSIPPQTLTNSGTTAGTVTYTITPTANNCPGSPVSYTVTVNPIPQATATPSTATICSGTATNIQLTSNVSNTTFSWTVSAPASITGASSGSGNSIQQTLTNSSSTTQTVTYTITPSANGCNGTPITVTVTVNPGAVTLNFNPSTQAICSGQTSQAVTISSPTSGVNITWTSQANGAGGVLPAGTTIIPAQTLTNTTNSPIQVIYAAVADYAGCISQPFNYIIIVNPIPTVTNTPLAQTVCEGVPTQQINLTSAVSGATFTWSASSPNGITGFAASGSGIAIAPQTLNNPADTAGTVVYTITPNANNCAGPASQYVITVNPTPNIILPTSQTICNGDTSQVVSLTSNVANTTFTWQSSAPSGVSGNTPIGTGNIPQQILVNSNSNAAVVTYIITATANGCSNTSTYNITIKPSPSVTFSLPPQTVCSGSSTALVTLSSSTTGAFISWTANVPSGITGAILSGTNTIPVQTLINNTFQPLTITYTAQAVTSGIVCPGTISNYTITVNPTPDVNATPMTDTICSATQTNIQITSNVLGTIFTWLVNAPNGVTGASSGTGNSIVQTLSNSSNNPLTVTYNIQTNATNCPGQSVSVNVVVNPSPVVQFSLPNQTICSGLTTQQVNISSPTVGASISWTSVSPSAVTGVLTNGGNIIPPQTLFNSSNIAQQVQYNASVNFSNCPGIASAYVITVNPTPHITNTDTVQTVCSGDSTTPIILISDVANTTFSWSGTANSTLTGYLPNGTSNPIPSQSISNSTNQSDTVYIAVTPTAVGCVGPSEIFKIAVNPRPVISLTPDSQSICTNNQSLPINISSNISTTSFSWSSVSQWVSGAIPYGTGNIIPPQGLYNTSPIADTGYVIFNVSPTAGGCPGQDISAYIQVNPTPVVNFAMNVNNGCSPLHVSFATNTLTYGKPDSLVFNWGDGTPNTVLYPNPIQPIWSTVQHVFVNNTFNAVTYTISLTAKNECGDTTVYQTVTVQPNVVDAFFTPSVTQGCEPLTVSFADFSTGATFTSWCFNYNTTSDSCLGASVVVQPGTSVSHTFTAGTYTVALYITDGCSQDTAFVTIQVSPSPTADFTHNNNVCKNAPVTFTQQSTPVSGTFLTAYQWFFGDGNSAIGSSVVHNYDSANIYNACLIVSASNGCSTTVCKPVTILSKPTVDFTAYHTCVNTQPTQFSNTSVGANFYQWDFGDGNTSILTNPGNNFQAPGTYTVTLIGSTNFCSDTISHPVIIYPKPAASFLTPATYICGVPANATLTNTSSGAFGYAWNFGNNTTSTVTNPIAVFSTPGTFNIQLVAANQFNCYDTATHPIDIYPFPAIQSIDIQPSEGCQPLQITVTANATNGNLYIWNFGDGTSNLSLTTPSATYTYPDTGTYTISVWVYSQADCGDTVILYDTVKVHINPIADFDFLVNTTVEPIDGTVIFTNTSQHAETYLWDFGDGFSSTVESPSHHYETVDSFYATLYAYNNFGCVDSISKSFYVFKRSLWVPNAFAPDFGGSNELVKIWKPVGIGLRYYHAQIFNTWGELLWESTKLENTQPSEGWDGTYRGNMCQQDVYVWKIEAVFMDGVRWDGMTYETGGKKKTIGSVTLVR